MRSDLGSAHGLALLRWIRKALELAVAVLVVTGCEAADGAPRLGSPVEGASGGPVVMASTAEDAGRYLILVGGCNDCHTDGYIESGGKVPETSWLTGSAVGFRGPWGTSYPKNLRRTAASMSEAEWVATLRSRQSLPPMPWPSVNAMSESDMLAIYRYLHSLGESGELTPDPLAPDVEPAGPWIDFVPRNMPVVQ